MGHAALKQREPPVVRREIVASPDAAGLQDNGYPGGRLTTSQLANAACIAVGEVFDTERLLLRAKERGARRMAHARTIAMALVHLVCGRSQEDVARAFRRNRTTASNHMEMIEALNDVPEHEAFWDALVLRFTRLVELMQAPSARGAWVVALRGLERALYEGEIEGDAVDQTRHVLGVFWQERCDE